MQVLSEIVSQVFEDSGRELFEVRSERKMELKGTVLVFFKLRAREEPP